jgi:hypothetical protein
MHATKYYGNGTEHKLSVKKSRIIDMTVSNNSSSMSTSLANMNLKHKQSKLRAQQYTNFNRNANVNDYIGGSSHIMN